ncbi:COX assembly mitochondrial protein 2 homolog [Stylophora pistillata]|uniref:COX assembly mitochondrial protein n=1 Tax=Stylophora pistillata TaxID=50429 RepID=A0A2B4SAD0_STYPI|nr:COX assembly mitochondrial protein 2 homolog [Stylophora pistillata]PFX26841.1 COX assembly mitochondrial protein 2-like [Stylophora pistillata]
MHPSLAPHLHNDCLQIIEELHRCHEEHPFRKFVGECNDIKRALDTCLKKEDLKRRRKNLEESRRRQKSMQEFYAEEK